MPKIDKFKFATSAMWKMMESLATKGTSTVISIILARILVPDDYGVIAVTNIFINFSALIVNSGMETSLVRKQHVDDLDYSNAFFFTLFVAAVLYGSFFLASPFLGEYYDSPLVASVLRVQMLSLFLCPFSVIRNAMVTRQLEFRKLCIVNLFATLTGGICGIIMAKAGFGVWALVGYVLLRDALSTFILLVIIKCRIVFQFSIKRAKELVNFSIWVLVASVTDFVGNNIYTSTFGKRYSMAELAYYNKGCQLPELVCLQTYNAITSVLLPTFSESQNDKERLKQITRKIVVLSAYVIWPMMTGLAVVGKRLIPILFTPKWTPSVPILWCACIIMGVNPLRSINMQLIYALGSSKKAALIECLRAFFLCLNLFITVFVFKLDIYYVTLGIGVVAVLNVLVTQTHTRRHIDYTFGEWLRDLRPVCFLCVVMGLAVYAVGEVADINSDMVTMCIQIATGILIYVIISVVMRFKPFFEILELGKNIFKRK